MKPVPSILLVQHRREHDRLRREYCAFAKALGLPEIKLRQVNAENDPIRPSLMVEMDALVIAGSPHMVQNPHTPQLKEIMELVYLAEACGKPVFGVCFGAQLVAMAYHGRVSEHVDAAERGTTEVELHKEASHYAVFRGLPSRFTVQQFHDAHIEALPDQATILATNSACIQAFAMSGRIFGTQFHPERTREDAEWILTQTPNANIVPEQLRESPHAPSILRAFREMI